MYLLMPAPIKFQLPTYLKCFIISAFSFLVLISLYHSGLYGPFLLDDLPSIQPAQLDTLSWSSLLEISTQNQSGPLGRSLSILSFALNHYFWGPDPYSYKLVNLILHFCMGSLLTWLSYLLISVYRPKIHHKLTISYLIGLIWLIHPLQVSTVLYAVQRMTILSQLFTTLACCFYVCARLKQRCHYAGLKWYVLSGICWILGLLSKETAILFPLYLFIIEYFILKFRTKSLKSSAQFYQYSKIFILLLIFIFLLSYWLYQDYFQSVFTEKPFSVIERLMTQINVLVFYIKLIYLPVLSKMSLYHDDFLIVHSINFNFLLSAFFLLILIASIILCRKRAPFVSLGLSWFFISHLLESTILPLELVFEHRNYLASFGLILIPITLIALWVQKQNIKFYKTHIVLGIFFILLLMSMTWTRSEQWSSMEKFLQAALIDKPNSARTHIEFANWLLTQNAPIQAYHELLKAQQIQPNNVGIDIHILLLHCYAEYVPTSIYHNIEKKIKQYPITPYVIIGLNQVVKNLFNQQCSTIDKDKVQHLIRTAYDNPFLAHRPKYKSMLYHLEAGMMLMNENKHDAKILLMRSFEIYPRRIEALIDKTSIEFSEGDIKNALSSIKKLSMYKNKLYAPKKRIELLEEKILSYQE